MSTEQGYTEAWLKGPLTTQFYTRTYKPPSTVNAVVVFVHGFADYCARYADGHKYYASKGFLVFTYDQRGFGKTVFDRASKSPGSSYGVTGGWDQQMADISWALEYAKNEYAKDNIPMFLMGHSMGGGEVLGYATQDPALSERAYLSGVIGSSPMVTQAHPANILLRKIGEILSMLLPNMLFPAAVPAEYLCKDKDIVAAAKKDPMMIGKGSLLGLNHMLKKGEELLNVRHAKWPQTLPLLVIHGTADEVTSHISAKTFFEKAKADKKEIKLFDGAFHEVHNEPEVKHLYLDTVVAWLEAHSGKQEIQPAAESSNS
ncbi:lysophospholipase [Flagelloscypha sp. PMI_526]|nr:lysophospholipase [Flagelloscypha sp. PMI_526]